MYTPEEIRQVQLILDTADPFLIEALYQKTEDEILEQLERLNREYELIPKTNIEWRKRHQAIIKTVQAMYQKHQINKNAPKGGLVIV